LSNTFDCALIIASRCNIALKNIPLFSRRFIRLQAVQHLYAFYVCKQANYDWALDQIRNDCTPDIFADPTTDKAQLAQTVKQAMALFESSLSSPTVPLVASPGSCVSTVAARALAHYESELAKDVCRLEEGFQEAVMKINRACVRIWQLLVEWSYIAQKQTERPQLNQQHTPIASGCISHSPILQCLQNDHVLSKLVQQNGAGWSAHMPLVEDWYNQFVKKDPIVQNDLEHPMTPSQDQQLLVFMVEKIIFNKKTIQAFFSDVDLQWSAHKHIARRLVHEGLSPFMKNSGKSLDVDVLGSAARWESEQDFYNDLIHRTLQRDEELELLIAQKVQKWSIDRIMLLDKTIIKLALCEMLYFVNIPIKVSINEYIALSKDYSMPKSSQFINGLLDAVAATLHSGVNSEI